MTHRIRLLLLVIRFGWALLRKLWRSESKYGWNSHWMRSSNDEMQAAFNQHLQKGDPVDVAAFCAFFYQRGWDCT